MVISVAVGVDVVTDNCRFRRSCRRRRRRSLHSVSRFCFIILLSTCSVFVAVVVVVLRCVAVVVVVVTFVFQLLVYWRCLRLPRCVVVALALPSDIVIV